MISNIFQNVFIYPLLNLLVFAYNYIPDIGIVIILITILIRLILLPSFHKSMKHQKALAELQPKMNEIREKYKDDKERQAKAVMELYSVHKVNPLSSCLPLLIQLPILLALYQVFRLSLNGNGLEGIYPFIQHPESISPMFLNFLDLAADKNYVVAGVAAVLQYFQGKFMQPKTQNANTDAAMRAMNANMIYILPVVIFIFGVQLPTGLGLYMITSTLFGIAQQIYIIRKEAHQVLEAPKK